MGFDNFLHQSFIKFFIVSSTLLISIETEPTEVFFNGKQYISYKPSKNPAFEHNNTNRIQLEFRTIYSNGVLVVMKGEGDDVLVLQLVNGVLRYIISKASEKHMEYSINSNLDDNKWHKIEIIRTETLNKFILDNKTKISLTPKTYKELSFNKEIFIGGGYNSITNKLQSLSTNMFIGCLKLHSINNRDPISYLMEGNNRVKVLPNGQLHTKCTRLTSQPISLTKTWSTLRIQVDENRTESYLKLNFSVKTMLLNGRIISTLKRERKNLGNHSEDNHSIEVNLRKGFLNLKLIYSRKNYSRALQSVEVPTSISDGTWHYVYVLITNGSATIEVDGKRYQRNLENSTGSLFFNPSVFFLGNVNEEKKESFIGCLHGIKLNSKIVPIPLDLRKGMFERICKLSCKPNPCQNNGICSQRGEDYHCDCTNTNFYGEKCEIYKYKSSCAEYMQMGLRTSSFCLLDADGTGDLRPYTTKCDFDNEDKPYTAISHNYVEEINTAVVKGTKLGRYLFYSPKYVVKSDIIESLIKKSESCRQEVRLRCKNTVVFHTPSGGSAIHWRTHQKDIKSYWGGVKDGEKGCACGKTNTCNEKGKLCNCDSKTLDWATDEGYLTEKQFLPVKRIQVDTNSLVNGSVRLYIGPLQCFAKKKRVVRSQTRKNTTLKRILSEVCMSVTKKDSLLDASKNLPDSFIQVEDELPYNPTGPVPSTASSQSGSNPKAVANKTGFLSPLTARSFLISSRTFGVLEIVVLSFAGLAFLILVIKFICCDRFCSRNDRGELILNQVGDCCMRDEFYESVGSQSNDGTMTKNNNGLAQNMKVTQNPLSSYWV